MTTKCRITNCSELAGFSGTAKGLCRSHYKRYLRYGDPEVPLRKISAYGDTLCLHVDCERKAKSLGLCEMHYVAKRRNQDPSAQKRRSDAFAARKRARQVSEAGRSAPDKCEICGEFHGRIVFDHCHNSGRFRGWICDRCNKVLGLVYDSGELLSKLRRYLEGEIPKDDRRAKTFIAERGVRSSESAQVSG